MLNNKKEFHVEYGGKTVTLETGRLAKQADGAVLATCGGTQVLVTVCSAKEANPNMDYFPLMVDYKEKYYAAGRFLGGFMKREGRPSDEEILLMRLIDRPFRPMFPKGYFNETIIMAQVISYDKDNDPEIIAALGASAALSISDIPFLATVGFAKVGKLDGNYVLNPSKEELEKSEIELIVAAKADGILMVEGEGDEVSNEDVLKGIMFAQKEIAKFCAVLETMKAEVGKPMREYVSVEANKTLMAKVTDMYTTQARECLNITDKLQRQNAVSALTKEVSKALEANPGDFGLTEKDSFGKEAYAGIDGLLYDMMRADILNEGKRIGGRGLTEVREIETEVDMLKNVHGTALFTRGETQVMGAVTLGGKEGDKMKDSIHGINFNKFYLHYTFAPFCVGEARGYRGVGRREVGHGNLAERALRKIIDFENCPYTIRVNCEVLESNGSSSMGSVCSGSMALMDAGVPMKGTVGGIAMGLVKSGDNFKILTDILGDEDHLGDMDFKLAGTKKGITAIQMDIKITGITEEILDQALEQAQAGRMHILNEMDKTITETRKDHKSITPMIKSIQVKPDKIGAVIGPGGKNVKGLQENFGVNVECKDDGTINVMGPNKASVESAIESIEMNVNGPKIDSVYLGKVVTIKEYGAFVDIAQGVSGLVHVSEMADERVNDVNEYLVEGDEIEVKVLEKDRFGKIKLSAKAVKALEKRA